MAWLLPDHRLDQSCNTSASKLLTRDMPFSTMSISPAKNSSIISTTGGVLAALPFLPLCPVQAAWPFLSLRSLRRPAIADLVALRDPHRLTLVPSVKWRKYLSRVGFLLATI